MLPNDIVGKQAHLFMTTIMNTIQLMTVKFDFIQKTCLTTKVIGPTASDNHDLDNTDTKKRSAAALRQAQYRVKIAKNPKKNPY